MPDALPPVGVLLSALNAATLPLAGTEEAFVMQGGQPRRTPVSSIGGAYYATGAATAPTFTPADEDEAWITTMGSASYVRWGAGTGPRAGDYVRVHGASRFEATPGDSGHGAIAITLPFLLDPARAFTVMFSSTHGIGYVFDVTDYDEAIIVVNLPMSDFTEDNVNWAVEYYTTNAVDP